MKFNSFYPIGACFEPNWILWYQIRPFLDQLGLFVAKWEHGLTKVGYVLTTLYHFSSNLIILGTIGSVLIKLEHL